MGDRLRIAFLGFRHGHVMGLYQAARRHPRVEVVAACGEHAETASALRHAAAAEANAPTGAGGAVHLTHASFEDVFEHVDFDAVAIGDVYARRGRLILRALEAGKHVISDKPLCTDAAELERIMTLTGTKSASPDPRGGEDGGDGGIGGNARLRGRGPRVGCLLDLRERAAFRTMRRLIVREGAIGSVRTVNFTAQHPLLLGRRPAWYFEPGKHGGTINDIGVHALDLIPWLTGRRVVEAVAARAWNARLPRFPWFQDAAQVMLRLDNDGGALGDLSYLAPDAAGYRAAQYWRVTCHGDAGSVEANYHADVVELTRSTDPAAQRVPLDPARPGGCLDDFLDEIEGTAGPTAEFANGSSGAGSAGASGDSSAPLTTRDVLDAARRALLVQRAADEGRARVPLE